MIFAVIIFSIFVAGAEIDIAIPSFPQMREFFQVSPFTIELVLGVNLFFHCIAALFCGALGDKFGNKRVINYGFLMFIIGSFICATTQNFYLLLFARAIQGVGVAPAMVLSFIIAIEHYSHKGQEKVMGLINGFATLSVCIAPTLGSYVNYYFGWHGNFWLLFMLGILALISFQIFIPDDKKNEKHIKIDILDYLILLKNRMVFLYVMAVCLTIGAYYTFVGIAPILYIESLGVDLKTFGFYQGTLTLVFGIFSIISGSFTKLVGKKNSFIMSIALIILFIVINSVITAMHMKNPIVITATLLLLSIGFVIPCNILFVIALDIIPSAKGRVSALISTIKWIFAIFGIQLASFFYDTTYTSIGIMITLMVLTSFIIAVVIWKEDEKLRNACLKD